MKEDPTIVAIVQARMTSTRLPGKVFMGIKGKPMIWHVINRLKYSKKLDAIVLAIPDTKENNVLEQFAKENNVKYFRGSEEDVLSRYYGAVNKFHIDIIVRIAADCPLIDPKIVDLVIEKHFNTKADYTSNTLQRTFPRGFDTEVFHLQALEKTYKDAKENYQREHVTSYIYEHPEIFQLENLEAQGELRHPELRLTVDTKEDLKLIKEIYKHLYQRGENFYIQDVINLFQKTPGLIKINIEVKQKDLNEK